MSSLSPRLQVRVQQKQILTPGLVQMVSLLQLNRLELKDMISAEVAQNPVLEESPDGGEELTPEELQPLLEAERRGRSGRPIHSGSNRRRRRTTMEPRRVRPMAEFEAAQSGNPEPADRSDADGVDRTPGDGRSQSRRSVRRNRFRHLISTIIWTPATRAPRRKRRKAVLRNLPFLAGHAQPIICIRSWRWSR